jgi:DNA mismatch endonuclease (patch repair protein)
LTVRHAKRSDVFSQAQRSVLMSRIGGKNTKPELALRKSLFALGLRYRIHPRDLPGTPDIAFPKYRTAVFMNGCFWHGHGCRLFKWPRSNKAFWRKKINSNMRRDKRSQRALEALGWRTLIVWECSIRRAPGERILALAKPLAEQIRANAAARPKYA